MSVILWISKLLHGPTFSFTRNPTAQINAKNPNYFLTHERKIWYFLKPKIRKYAYKHMYFSPVEHESKLKRTWKLTVSHQHRLRAAQRTNSNSQWDKGSVNVALGAIVVLVSKSSRSNLDSKDAAWENYPNLVWYRIWAGNHLAVQVHIRLGYTAVLQPK